MVMRLPLISDDLTLLEIYCDTFEFSSVREYLLSIDPEIEHKARDFVRRLDIFDACRDGNLLAVKVFILIMNIDIEAKDRFGGTALHYASSNGHKEIVEFLLSKDCDVNAIDYDGWTALYLASYMGHRDVIKILENHSKHLK